MSELGAGVDGDDEPDPDLTQRGAAFRISGAGLDPAEVTACLGLDPTTVRVSGETCSLGLQSVSDDVCWVLAGSMPPTTLLREMFEGLLEHLEQHARVLRAFREHGLHLAFVGAYIPGWAMGDVIHFPPGLLARMSALGIQFDLDVYPPLDEGVLNAATSATVPHVAAPTTDETTRDAVFRILSRELDPHEITTCLGVQPTEAFARGDPHPLHPEMRRHTGLWLLRSHLPRTTPPGMLVVDLVTQLAASGEALREYRTRGYHVSILCGYMPELPERDILSFPAPLLGRLAELSIQLEIVTYPA